MWPMKLDMTKEECRGVLRRLELESYGSLISTFRAQGFLCKEKLRILDDLRRILHISNDRHRAEARRVANDERLYTVAEIICGPNSSQDWRREGHRTFPILPRSVPHTALTYIANTVYEQLTRANCKMAHPANTSCNRLKKAEDMFKFELVRKGLALVEKGFERDAAVVTSDPLQDIMSKSYIINEDKRTGFEESKPEEAMRVPEEVPASETEHKTDAPETAPTVPANEQPSLSDILLDNTSSPTISSNTKGKVKDKSAKSAERAKKKAEKAPKRQGKVKSPYPAGKPSKNGPLNSAKQSSKATSIPSPHLMHSYAVPFDVVSATNGGHYYPEPPQLQQHLTANLPYPPPLNYRGQHPFLPYSYGASKGASPVMGHSHAYKHQQGILPSSKKDIQYNLSKLNPTNSVQSTKGVIANVPPRAPNSGSPFGAKSLPPALLNYQKKTNSKNILIPTSAAAATLASLGLPMAEHTSDWISSSGRESSVKPSKMAQAPHEAPSPRVVFSPPPALPSAPEDVPSGGSSGPSSGQETQAVCPPASSSGGVVHTSTSAYSSELTATSSARASVAFSAFATSPAVHKVLPLKQPNIAGFTPVKSGSKLSVSKMQLMPLVSSSSVPQPAPVGVGGVTKNNVFILPKPNLPGTLNVGQRISISKSIIDPAGGGSQVVTCSPPKVIVQPVPNVNSVASFDLDTERKEKAKMRQLFATEQLPSEASQGLTPMEIAAGGIVKAVDNGQRAVAAEGVAGQPQIANMSTTGVDGGPPPVRKITISASQLIPFKGKLRDGTALPMAAISANSTPGLPVGMKPIKLANCTVVESVSSTTGIPAKASKTITDWEQEVDRVNSTQQAAPSGELITALPEPVARGEVVQKVEVNMDASQQPDESLQHPGRNGLENRKLESSVTETEVAVVSSSNQQQVMVEASQGDYEPSNADRGDDSSATDSADAEEDPEDESARIGVDDGIEEDDYDEQEQEEVDRTADLVASDTDGIIVEEEEVNFDCLIEEVPEDETYIEEIVDEQMEISYESSRELEHTSEHIVEEEAEEQEEEHVNMNGVEEEEHAEVHFVPCDMIADETLENGDSHQPTATAAASASVPTMRSAKDDIVCELLEIDADGTYSTRQFSYEQAIAEGLTALPTRAKPSQKTNRSVS